MEINVGQVAVQQVTCEVVVFHSHNRLKPASVSPCVGKGGMTKSTYVLLATLVICYT